MKMKLWEAMLAFSLALSGCSRSTTLLPDQSITAQNAPNDLFKTIAQITALSDPNKLKDIIPEILENTTYPWNSVLNYSTFRMMEFDYKEKDQIDTPFIESSRILLKSYKVLASTGQCFYALDGKKNESHTIYTISQKDRKSQKEVLLFLEDVDPLKNMSDLNNAEVKITHLEKKKCLEFPENLSIKKEREAAQAFILAPIKDLFENQETILPFIRPDQFDFSFVQRNGSYILRATFNDSKSLEDLLKEHPGYVPQKEQLTTQREESLILLDSYQVQFADWTLNLNENGGLNAWNEHIIERMSQEKTAPQEVREIDYFNSNQLKEEPLEWKDFFELLFQSVQNGTLKEGDVFTLFDAKTLSKED